MQINSVGDNSGLVSAVQMYLTRYGRHEFSVEPSVFRDCVHVCRMMIITIQMEFPFPGRWMEGAGE